MRVEKNPKHLHVEFIVTSHNSVTQGLLLLNLLPCPEVIHPFALDILDLFFGKSAHSEILKAS